MIPWFKSSFQLRMDDKKQTEIPVSRVQTKRLARTVEAVIRPYLGLGWVRFCELVRGGDDLAKVIDFKEL